MRSLQGMATAGHQGGHIIKVARGHEHDCAVRLAVLQGLRDVPHGRHDDSMDSSGGHPQQDGRLDPGGHGQLLDSLLWTAANVDVRPGRRFGNGLCGGADESPWH